MTTWQSYVDFLLSKGELMEVMIVSSEDGALWAGSPNFQLREYKATIVQEDGSDQEETVNEAKNLVTFMAGQKPPQGLRLNGGKKQQILRQFKDEGTEGTVIYGKITKGGCCVAAAGACILIGTFDELSNHTSVGCNELITLMAKYLVKSTWPTDPSQLGGANAATWQPYIDQMLVAKGNVAAALIMSKEDGTVYAKSPTDFCLQTYEADIPQEDGTDRRETVDEMKNILHLMRGAGKPPQGLRVREKKYQVLRSFTDEECGGAFTVYGKKTMGGCCLLATNIAIVLALFEEKEGHTSAGCNVAVSELGKFLLSKNM